MSDWRPAATQDMLVARAALYRQIREFFLARQVLEVDTPLLSRSIGTDPQLHPVTAAYQGHPAAAPQTLYLQTSPEFAMKRLLAAGSGPIYQLGKAVRNGESGVRHNPEFTMLEWYRPGFSLEQLMDEVAALVALVLGPLQIKRISYRDLFLQTLDIDPHVSNTAALQVEVARHIDTGSQTLDRNACLDLLYSHCIEPGLQEAVFIKEFPAAQAALAKTAHDGYGNLVARRFELVIGGMEIANGYDELQDVVEQERRFGSDLERRRQQDLPAVPVDERYLAALRQGLPDCCGVALGVDRLLMLASGARHIDEVLAFPLSRV